MGFEENGMIYVSQSSIVGQTFHWHDELELLLVVEGSLDLKVGYEWFRLKAGDIMLINSDEIHSMKETNEKNVVICVYIDCNASYEKYPDFYEIVALWPYSEAFHKLNQRKHVIMEHVNRLAVLIDQNADRERIARQFDSFLKSLIYCYRVDITDLNGAAFQVTDEKMDIIYRTIKYLYSNYDHKVNLQDVSEQEYLSMFYLSHKFKDITGYSFRDWLNFVRVEKAEKLLLNTSSPITEIAYQCGFSDVRYFNKHFMKWYKISPNKYRKLFRESCEMYDDTERFEEPVPMVDIIHKIESIVPEIKADADTENEIVIDLNTRKVAERLDPSWKEKLWCGGSNIIGYRKMKQIEEAQKDIEFMAIIADELFSAGIQQTEDTSMPQLHSVLNFLLDIFAKVYLIVGCSKDDQYEIDAAEESLRNFFKFYPRGRAAQMEFKIDMADNERETKEKIKEFTALLDSLNIRHKQYEHYKRPVDKRGNVETDYISNMIDGEIRMDWLYSKNGFKNNLYYFYFFLSKMGEAVVVKEESYVITRKEDDFQILFHNGGTKFKYPQQTEYKLILKNFRGSYKSVHYAWNSQRDDISSVIKNPNVIRYLSDSEYEMVDQASLPMISVDYIDEDQLKDKAFALELPPAAADMQLTLLIKV
ncbi:AraC family transcriptional regulator [Hominibacterium faecale]|uniref:AraC family transcriptional regulator n=1 Tax=Hominibacterium faecale TaxID=2839743 RepID=UPI0022B298EA|nr:AraC family transcriptional regulator [Hominibacterium faecale]